MYDRTIIAVFAVCFTILCLGAMYTDMINSSKKQEVLDRCIQLQNDPLMCKAVMER